MITHLPYELLSSILEEAASSNAREVQHYTYGVDTTSTKGKVQRTLRGHVANDSLRWISTDAIRQGYPSKDVYYRDPYCSLRKTVDLFTTHPALASSVRRIFFDGFYGIETTAMIFQVLKHCDQLDSVALPWITLRYGSHIDWSHLLRQRANGTSLQSLELLAVDLKQSQIRDHARQVDKHPLDSDQVNFGHLRRIKLSGSSNLMPINDDDLTAISRTAQLQELHITGTTSVTIKGLVSLSRASEATLRVLEHSPLSDDGFEHPNASSTGDDSHLCNETIRCPHLRDLAISLPTICTDLFSDPSVEWIGDVKIRAAGVCGQLGSMAQSSVARQAFFNVLSQARSLIKAQQQRQIDLNIEIYIDHFIFEPSKKLVHADLSVGEILSAGSWPVMAAPSSKGPYGQTGQYGKDERAYQCIYEEEFLEGLQKGLNVAFYAKRYRGRGYGYNFLFLSSKVKKVAEFLTHQNIKSHVGDIFVIKAQNALSFHNVVLHSLPPSFPSTTSMHHIPLPTAHHHPSPLATLTPYLLPLLPNSLPLLRRIQHQPPSPHSHVFATFPPTGGPPLPSSSSNSGDSGPRNPGLPPFEFAACWVDRTRAPETECWIFSTWELKKGVGTAKDKDKRVNGKEDGCDEHESEKEEEIKKEEEEEEEEEEARLNLLAVLNAIAGLDDSSAATTNISSDAGNKQNNRNNSNLVIIGSLHESLLPLLVSPTDRFQEQKVTARYPDRDDDDDDDVKGNSGGGKEEDQNDIIDANGRGVLSRIGVKIMKYLIPPPPPSSPPTFQPQSYQEAENESTIPKTTSLLPSGYIFDSLTTSDLQTCVRKTDIPRTAATLAPLKNACVRYTHIHNQPGSSISDTTPSANGNGKGQIKEREKEEREELVAWVFLASDGSLSSLFVEPAHRGRGLARGVVRRLLLLLLMLTESGEVGDRDDGDGGRGEEEKGKGWVSSDVYLDNEGGRGVAAGVGGKEAWICRWVGCDLGRVRSVWGRLMAERACIK
ncbi:MAG: hypothetical protein Q9169_004049 [Polycauliona sp. 2 TL-2023]